MSDTPRTDATYQHPAYPTWEVAYEGMTLLARALERELAASIIRFSKADADAYEKWRMAFEADRVNLAAKANAAEEARDGALTYAEQLTTALERVRHLIDHPQGWPAEITVAVEVIDTALSSRAVTSGKPSSDPAPNVTEREANIPATKPEDRQNNGDAFARHQQDAARWRALMRAGVTFHECDGEPPVLASVSKRFWYHATDDQENNTLADAMDAYAREFPEAMLATSTATPTKEK